jgi:hypothetical protein
MAPTPTSGISGNSRFIRLLPSSLPRVDIRRNQPRTYKLRVTAAILNKTGPRDSKSAYLWKNPRIRGVIISCTVT